MAGNIDLSDYSEDELTQLIDEANNLRTTKFEERERELRTELDERKLEREIQQERARGAAAGMRH